MRNRLIAAALFASGLGTLLLVAGGLGATAAQELDGATLFATKTCIACHGPDAKTPILPMYPKLAGQNEAYVLQQMRDIKSGARNNGQTAAMFGVMHLVNEAEIEVLAHYISTLVPFSGSD